MKIEKIINDEPRLINMSEMRHGQVGRVLSQGYSGTIVACVGTDAVKVVVSLSGERHFWSGDSNVGGSNTVELFNPGTVLEVVV